MNTKGGCGKTTVATNLASYCSSQGYGTALFDYDRQASATRWLKERSADHTFIHGVAAFSPPKQGTTRAWQMQVPTGTRFIITDTPAGHAGVDMEDRVAETDVILIPVLPSTIDIHSTSDFIHDLLAIGKARERNKKLAIIANRTRQRTKAADKLERFLETLDIPVIATLRDTQNYLHAAEQGVGVHELVDQDTRKDSAAWSAILSWLHRGTHTNENHVLEPRATVAATGST